jgi:hypothetical protein
MFGVGISPARNLDAEILAERTVRGIAADLLARHVAES